jgi:hypothetical protein
MAHSYDDPASLSDVDEEYFTQKGIDNSVSSERTQRKERWLLKARLRSRKVSGNQPEAPYRWKSSTKDITRSAKHQRSTKDGITRNQIRDWRRRVSETSTKERSSRRGPKAKKAQTHTHQDLDDNRGLESRQEARATAM